MSTQTTTVLLNNWHLNSSLNNVPITISRDYLMGYLEGSLNAYLVNKNNGFPQLTLAVACKSGPFLALVFGEYYGCGHVYLDPSPANANIVSCRWRVAIGADVERVLRDIRPDLIVLRPMIDVGLEIIEQAAANSVLRAKLRADGPDVQIERELSEGVRRIYSLEAPLEAAKRGGHVPNVDEPVGNISRLGLLNPGLSVRVGR